MYKVFVNGVMKKTMMSDTRIMYLDLIGDDDVDVVCDMSQELHSFTARQDGNYTLTLSKEGVFRLRPTEEEE